MYVTRQLQLVNSIDRPELARRDRRIHLLHVPKCGGTTLRYMLEAYAAIRGLTVANEARRTDGQRPDLEAAEVAMGHMRPAGGISRADTCYITLLRDPVGRLRSLVAMHATRRGQTHEAVVKDLTWTDANWAVHLLSGATGPDDDAVAVSKEVLANRVHVFGFQEGMAEFMALLGSTLQIDGLIYPSFQYTPKNLQVDRCFDAAFAAMADADSKLYVYAQALYRERFAPLVAGAASARPIPSRTYLRVRIQDDGRHVDVDELRASE